MVQLWGAIVAVFESWNNPRAKIYRRMHGIPESWGTACNVQAMVFGNLGDDSATGVAFSRDPSTGRTALFGEWLPNAQGEDVVAGIRTPLPLRSEGADRSAATSTTGRSLEEAMPAVYRELVGVRDRLEEHFRDMQDIEFTIQRGKLFLLQCRAGKRTARAAVRMAVEMVARGAHHERRGDPAGRRVVDRSAAAPRARPRAPRRRFSRAGCQRARVR